MKTMNKFKRMFVGRGTCLGAVQWTVSVTKDYQQKKYPGKLAVDGEFGVNDEAKNHWVESRKDLVPLLKLEKQLADFLATMQDAMLDVQDHNEALGYGGDTNA